MEPVDGGPIIKCGKSGCAGSSPLLEVEYRYKAGVQPSYVRDLWDGFPATEHQ